MEQPAATVTPIRRPSDMPARAPKPKPADRTPLLRDLFGRLLRRARLAQGRTLADVADEAGVSMPYLSEIERGLKEPSSEVLEAVCIALGATVADLIGAAHRELATTHAPAQVRSLRGVTERRTTSAQGPVLLAA